MLAAVSEKSDLLGVCSDPQGLIARRACCAQSMQARARGGVPSRVLKTAALILALNMISNARCIDTHGYSGPTGRIRRASSLAAERVLLSPAQAQVPSPIRSGCPADAGSLDRAPVGGAAGAGPPDGVRPGADLRRRSREAGRRGAPRARGAGAGGGGGLWAAAMAGSGGGDGRWAMRRGAEWPSGAPLGPSSDFRFFPALSPPLPAAAQSWCTLAWSLFMPY